MTMICSEKNEALSFIQELGGYDAAKLQLQQLKICRWITPEMEKIESALLEYRREYSFFDVDDKVFFDHVISIQTVSRVRENGDVEIQDWGWVSACRIVHATPEEIKAERRINFDFNVGDELFYVPDHSSCGKKPTVLTVTKIGTVYVHANKLNISPLGVISRFHDGYAVGRVNHFPSGKVYRSEADYLKAEMNTWNDFIETSKKFSIDQRRAVLEFVDGFKFNAHPSANTESSQ